MKSRIIFFSFLFTVIMFQGCRLALKNGEIPNQYLEEASEYEGSFPTRLNGLEGVLHVRLEGKRPTVDLEGFADGDLIEEGCESKIGWAKSIVVEENSHSKFLKTIEFLFSPGDCSQFLKGDYVRFELHYQYNASSRRPEFHSAQFVHYRNIPDEGPIDPPFGPGDPRPPQQ